MAAFPSGSSGPGKNLPAARRWSRQEHQEGSEYPRQDGEEDGPMVTGEMALPGVPSVAAVAAAAGMSGLAYQRQQRRQGAWP